MQVDFQNRQLSARIVYWGPAGSGKSTNLRHLRAQTPGAEAVEPEPEGEHEVLKLAQVRGFDVSVDLVEIAAGLPVGPTLLRLKGVDAVIFVADSAPARAEANVASLAELRRHLGPDGLALNDVDLVFQLNKRDLDDALPLDALEAALGVGASVRMEAVAQRGLGVSDTIKAAVKLTLARFPPSRAKRAR